MLSTPVAPADLLFKVSGNKTANVKEPAVLNLGGSAFLPALIEARFFKYMLRFHERRKTLGLNAANRA